MIVIHMQDTIQHQKWVQTYERILSIYSYSLLLCYTYEKFDILTVIFIKQT